MSWVKMLLLGNIGQQLDIEDFENDVVRLRARLSSQRTTDRTQDEALLTLRREITDLKLVVGELTRLLVAGGTLPAEAIERLVRGIDARPTPPSAPT
jgi:hypothetical protein